MHHSSCIFGEITGANRTLPAVISREKESRAIRLQSPQFETLSGTPTAGSAIIEGNQMPKESISKSLVILQTSRTDIQRLTRSFDAKQTWQIIRPTLSKGEDIVWVECLFWFWRAEGRRACNLTLYF